jgi:hypothetical protein
MMIKKKHSFMALLIALLLSACSSKESGGCPLPPKGFSESDLVGTWSAIDSLQDSAFIIREDGLYKQTMYVERTRFKYESDWQPWRVTYSDKRLPYLHLEGLLMCAYWFQMNCSTGKTGVEPLELDDTKDPFGDATYWYDDCQRDWVNTPGEGVFMVFKTSGVINLVPFTKSPDGMTGPVYILREP